MPTDDAARTQGAVPILTDPSRETVVESDAASTSRLTERLAVLEQLAERPLHEHAEVYQGLHAELQAALADIDGA